MKSRITIRMGAGKFTAEVRGKGGKSQRFDIRKMDKQGEHNFRRELVKAFRKAGEA